MRESAQYEQLHRRAPSATEFRNAFVAQGAFGAAFAGFAIFFMVTALGGMNLRGAIALPFVLIPGLFVVIGGVLIVKSFWAIRKLAAAPLRTEAAIIIGKRERTSGERNQSITYHVTLQTERGRRVELKAPSRVYGMAAPDDAGIAWTKDEYLLEFRRIDA